MTARGIPAGRAHVGGGSARSHAGYPGVQRRGHAYEVAGSRGIGRAVTLGGQPEIGDTWGWKSGGWLSWVKTVGEERIALRRELDMVDRKRAMAVVATEEMNATAAIAAYNTDATVRAKQARVRRNAAAAAAKAQCPSPRKAQTPGHIIHRRTRPSPSSSSIRSLSAGVATTVAQDVPARQPHDVTEVAFSASSACS